MPSGSEDIGQENEDFVLAPNEETIFASGVVMDSNLNNLGLQTLDLAESVDADYVFGSAISADGGLIFRPGDGLIDVFDGLTGSFRARVSLPFMLSPNYRALISNHKDSQLVAITGATGNGIAVIDLDSLPEPQPRTCAVSKGERPMCESPLESSRMLSITGKPEPRTPRMAPRIQYQSTTLRLQRSPSQAKSPAR